MFTTPAQRRRAPFLIATLAILVPGLATAATWSIPEVSGYPGDTVQISVRIRGDGVTVGADAVYLFDESTLALPPISGAGTDRSGYCRRGGATDRFLALTYSVGLSPLSSTETEVCLLPFRIRDNARPGLSLIRPLRAECPDAAATPRACAALAGKVTVLSRSPSLPAGSTGPVASSSLAIMVSAAPGAPRVEALAAHDYRRQPQGAALAALRQIPPQALRALNRERPQGDLRRYLDLYPALPEARLDRYVIAEYASVEARDRALAAALRDPHVEFAYVPPALELALETGAAGKSLPPDTSGQPHLGMLNLPRAWRLASGWGVVGIADNGLAPEHPELRSFTGPGSRDGSFVPGGNYLPYFSSNLGGFGQPADNLAEDQPNLPPTLDEAACAGTNGWLQPIYAGHGTHVSGLVGANALDGTPLSGACPRCGIAARKFSYWWCDTSTSTPSLRFGMRESTTAQSIGELSQTGAQVLSLSYGTPVSSGGVLRIGCEVSNNQQTATCLALDIAQRNGIVIAAAAGNSRSQELNFPASDKRVVAVGGVAADGVFWDESPGSRITCPLGQTNSECGSNYQAVQSATARQEAVALARQVRSTAFPGFDWSRAIGCGDSYGEGTDSDGSGLCTGTSMSTPQIAGVLGLLRSINPLAPVGDPFGLSPGSAGVRDVLAASADRAGAWDRKYGFGMPDAEAAARRMLGLSAGDLLRNRVTPLFALFSPGHNDYAAVASPQLAIALSLYQTRRYYSTTAAAGTVFLEGTSVPGYSAFPNPDAGSPRAAALVLTTEHSPHAEASLVPLYLLDRCSSPTCSSGHDFVLLTDPARVEAAVAAGYRYAGLQGYVYAACAPAPACLPPGAENLHLKCRLANSRCAVFLERDRARFEAAGYTNSFIGSGGSILGLAYPLTDSDGDGLPDAMERLLGSSPTLRDSNGDGIEDGVAYPFAGIPLSDPCLPQGQCTRRPSRVFRDGFE
jgi:serine protease